MDHLLDEDIYTNDVQYFFSLHGPRFEYMNTVMAASLSKKFGKEFRPIRILNAWPSRKYDSLNYIVLNKRSYNLTEELKKPVIFLPDYEDVNQEFSQDPFIMKIAKELLKKQDTVYVFPFTTAFLDLPPDCFTVLGPNSILAKSLDNKINQFKLFKRLGLPHNKVRIFESEADLLEHEHEVVPSYVSAAYTSGGNESGLVYSPEMLREFLVKLRPINKKDQFIVAGIFEDIVLAPNVNAIVTSDGKVYTLVLSDQILQGNRYLGNIYPSESTDAQKLQMQAITETIGKYLASQGYVGLFGCDFLINKAGELVVIDLNPRHQGGYVCNGLFLEKKGISLTDLELSVLLDEDVSLSQEELNKNLDFAWSHSKIIPYEKGQVIHGEHQHNSIQHPFTVIGDNFSTEFYKEGSVFIQGYIGYQVHSSKDRGALEAMMLKTREEFDIQVLGL